MSQKKRKKRRAQGPSGTKAQQQVQGALASELAHDEKRLSPVARNLLLLDLVLLAAVGLLVNHEMISDLAANVLSVVGIILMMIALWFQFGRKKPRDGSGWSDLR